MQQSPLESSLYYAATWLKLSLLDPSVSYLDDRRRKHWDWDGKGYLCDANE
ncbi:MULTISPECIES: hypothetical protein [unclassified Wolbachia]|uniref:hypothetical protein n=1 Tax=unclassified Wolbachia TaxID=2640676 RepID=UPI0030D1F97A